MSKLVAGVGKYSRTGKYLRKDYLKIYACWNAMLRRGTVDYRPCDPVNSSSSAIFGSVYITCGACPMDSPQVLQKFLEELCLVLTLSTSLSKEKGTV